MRQNPKPGHWRTRDGREVKIREMSDSHLKAAIATLDRIAPVAARRLAMQADAYSASTGGEHASYAAADAARQLYDLADGDDEHRDVASEMFPEYDQLVAERQRRIDRGVWTLPL